MPRKGDLKSGVERYESGRIKYEQDYKAQYEANKGRRIPVVAKLPPEIADEFDKKLEAENTNRNAKIKGWIMDYLSGKLK